jgi:hypothetical protein
MSPYKSPLETAVPNSLEVRREIVKAILTLAGDQDERLRPRRAEIASLRRDLEDIAEDIAKLRREGSLLILSELRKYGYNPNEARIPKYSLGGGRWTKGGIEIAQAGDGPLSPLEPRESTGISQIDDVTKKLKEILTKTMNGLARLPGQPQRYGKIVHVAFAGAVIEEGIRGISPFDVERPFPLPADYGSTKRRAIPDVVLRNDIGDIIAIYDVKTGDATVDPWRARELRAATGVGPEVPIIILHPHEVTFKTWLQLN